MKFKVMICSQSELDKADADPMYIPHETFSGIEIEAINDSIAYNKLRNLVAQGKVDNSAQLDCGE